MVSTGLIYAVDEPYDDISAGMDGSDLLELHRNGVPTTFRVSAIIAASDDAEGMRPYYLAPGGMEDIPT